MQTATKVSLEEFVANPDPHYYDFHELHDGEIVELPSPSIGHMRLQEKLAAMLRSALVAIDHYFIKTELFYTLPGEARRADIGVVLLERLDQPGAESKSFFGAPDLVIEILSPSNTTLDLNHIRRVCLQNGAIQFWVVDAVHQSIVVYKRDSPLQTELGVDDAIPLDFLSGCAVSVSVKSLFE